MKLNLLKVKHIAIALVASVLTYFGFSMMSTSSEPSLNLKEELQKNGRLLSDRVRGGTDCVGGF